MSTPNSASMSLEGDQEPSDIKLHSRPNPLRCKPMPSRDFHLINESAKFCKVCGAKQKRTITVYTANATQCQKYRRGDPHRSHRWYFSNLGITRWLVSPPDPVPYDNWFLVEEECLCTECASGRENKKPRLEKVYRRSFGRLDVHVFFPLKTACPALFGFERFEVKPFSEFEKKYRDSQSLLLPHIVSI